MKSIWQYIFPLFLFLSLVSPCKSQSATDREQEVRELVTTLVNNRTGGMGWDVNIRRINVQDSLKLPEGLIEYEIVAPQQWQGWGNTTVMVLARQKDRVIRNIPVRIEVEALADTVLTIRQVEHGSTIKESDVTLQKREITQNSYLAARKLEDIIGKNARTTLKANQPVRADQVEKISMIKSGQMVTIIAESDVLKISVIGKARSSGGEGDIIKVQNLTSLKEIPARVIDASTVQIPF